MSSFKEHKATIISIAISLAAFCIFFVSILYYESLQKGKLPVAEHSVIQALFPEEPILLYGKTIKVPEAARVSGNDMASVMDFQFESMQCLEQMENEDKEITGDFLTSGNITVYDDDWYTEVSKVERFRESLFAEGYFGLIQVSRPCYSMKRDRAILYSERDCGSGCSNGHVVFLALKDGHWTRVMHKVVWKE